MKSAQRKLNKPKLFLTFFTFARICARKWIVSRAVRLSWLRRVLFSPLTIWLFKHYWLLTCKIYSFILSISPRFQEKSTAEFPGRFILNRKWLFATDCCEIFAKGLRERQHSDVYLRAWRKADFEDRCSKYCWKIIEDNNL